MSKSLTSNTDLKPDVPARKGMMGVESVPLHLKIDITTKQEK